MRKNPHATTNAGNQGNRAPPPPPTTTHQVHNPQPPLERRLQEGPRRQSASTVRPKGQGFRPGKGGGGGGRIWKLDPPSRGRTAPERRRRRGRREIDQGFPPFQDSTTPSSARSDGPATKSGEEATARGRGREEESRPPQQQGLAALTPPTRPEGTTSTCARHPPERSTPPSPTRAAALASRAPHSGVRQQILAATFTGRRAAAGRLLGWRRGGGRREERRRRLGFGAAPESPERGDTKRA